MNKKSHLAYTIISVCALIVYGGFIIKNAVTSQNEKIEETLPQNEIFEDFDVLSLEDETVAPVDKKVENVPDKDLPQEETESDSELESETEEASEIYEFSPLLPVNGKVSREFSMKHTYNSLTDDWRTHPGIDIDANRADKVMSTEDGTVISACKDPLWGNVIEIDHGEYISIYKNLSTLDMVKVGDFVARGEAISGVGESKDKKRPDPYIHFEITHFEEYVDPLTLIES